MMRYLQGLNWTLLAVGASFTVVLSVVSLLFYLHVADAPQYQPQFEAAKLNTAYFAAVMLSAAAAAWTLRRRHILHWPAEILLLATCVATVMHFLP
jgi:hypothetical protein